MIRVIRVISLFLVIFCFHNKSYSKQDHIIWIDAVTSKSKQDLSGGEGAKHATSPHGSLKNLKNIDNSNPPKIIDKKIASLPAFEFDGQAEQGFKIDNGNVFNGHYTAILTLSTEHSEAQDVIKCYTGGDKQYGFKVGPGSGKRVITFAKNDEGVKILENNISKHSDSNFSAPEENIDNFEYCKIGSEFNGYISELAVIPKHLNDKDYTDVSNYLGKKNKIEKIIEDDTFLLGSIIVSGNISDNQAVVKCTADGIEYDIGAQISHWHYWVTCGSFSSCESWGNYTNHDGHNNCPNLNIHKGNFYKWRQLKSYFECQNDGSWSRGEQETHPCEHRGGIGNAVVPAPQNDNNTTPPS